MREKKKKNVKICPLYRRLSTLCQFGLLGQLSAAKIHMIISSFYVLTMVKQRDAKTKEALTKAIVRMHGENNAECVFCGIVYAAFDTGRFRPPFTLM